MSETELNNMSEMEIKEEENTQSIVDPIRDLVEHDFSSDTKINLDESYEMISIMDRASKEMTKEREAQTIIDEIGETYIKEDYKLKLDNSFKSVNDFLKKYNVELDEVMVLTEPEKDKVFAIASFLLKNVTAFLNELNFKIDITRDEYKLVSTALERKMVYDGNDVFNIIELNHRYLMPWKETERMLAKDMDSFEIEIDIKNVVMLYHFLGKHTVKGLDKQFYFFASILEKIAETNKLYNAYNVLKERLDVDFGFWNGAFSANLETETEEKPELSTKQ